jgi:hypothetical protein
MVTPSSQRLEEDAMLKYAHVQRTVEKHYAIRYNGYVDDLPYFFLRDLIDKNRMRGSQLELLFLPLSNEPDAQFDLPGVDYTDTRNNQKCVKGDWIVVSANKTEIMTDLAFRNTFVSVTDLLY